MGNTQDSNRKVNNTIKYKNSVIEDEDTKITLKIFKEIGNEAENVAVFILNYNLKEDEKTTPYKVVLGKIALRNNLENLSAKAKVVRDYLLAQLKENNKKTNSYEYCRYLMNTCKKQDIPFIYTDEGIEIATNDAASVKVIEKTYNLQEKNDLIELRCLNPHKKMNLNECELKIREKINEKIKEHRLMDAAMEELKTEEERNQVIRGKQINELRNETSKEVIMDRQRKTIADFLTYEYEKNQGKKELNEGNKLSMKEYLAITEYLKSKNSDKKVPISLVIGEDDEQSNAEKYFRLKEKGIAIDIRKMLEDSQNELLEKQIKESENNEKPEDVEAQNNKDNYINNCKTIFDFIKQGRDVNTQFFYSMKIDGFEQLYSIVEEQKDKTDKDGNKVYNSEEILEYLKMKEQMLKTVKLDKKKSFLDYELYANNELVRKFMKFVMKSEVRNDTRKEEKEVLLEMYQEMMQYVIKNHRDDVELFNTYAERFNIDLCPIPEEMDKSKEEQEEQEEK